MIFRCVSISRTRRVKHQSFVKKSLIFDVFLDVSASLWLDVSTIYQCWKNTAVFQDISITHLCLRNGVCEKYYCIDASMGGNVSTGGILWQIKSLEKVCQPIGGLFSSTVSTSLNLLGCIYVLLLDSLFYLEFNLYFT